VAGVIYVVDDEALMLEMAAVVLGSLGYAVETFPNAEAALAAFAKAPSRPGLIITDHGMGEMSGVELIAACRRVEPEQKMMLVSGTLEEQVFRDTPCKPNLFLAKPYGARDLIEAVVALVGPAGHQPGGTSGSSSRQWTQIDANAPRAAGS
jgi:CheY-like chemotaxis protein